MTARKRPRTPASKAGPEFGVGDRVRVSMGAPAAYRGQIGRVVEVAGKDLYLVEVEDGDRARLYSWWLDAQPD